MDSGIIRCAIIFAELDQMIALQNSGAFSLLEETQTADAITSSLQDLVLSSQKTDKYLHHLIICATSGKDKIVFACQSLR